MYLRNVKPPEDMDKFLEQEVGYHYQIGYDYIESMYVAEVGQNQVLKLRQATEELYQMSLAAVEKVIRENRFKEFCVGPLQAEHIKASWDREGADAGKHRDPELYCRFDFCWDGEALLKFYEINGDTPTTAYECSVVQWAVLQDLIKRGELPSGTEQFNQLEERIIDRFSQIRDICQDKQIDHMHFSCMTDWREDLTTTSYLEALAQKAGWKTSFIDINLIGANENILSDDYGSFYDLEEKKIEALYKLMPWEHLYEAPYAQHIARDKVFYIEPAWRAILSNKMLSVLLWEMYPGHPYLLPTYTTLDKFGSTYVEKPVFGRISAGIKVVENGIVTSKRRFDPDEPVGTYEKYPKTYQEFCPLPRTQGLNGWRYVTGVWVVGEKAAAMDFRMDTTLVSGGGRIKFIPHIVV